MCTIPLGPSTCKVTEVGWVTEMVTDEPAGRTNVDRPTGAQMFVGGSASDKISRRIIEGPHLFLRRKARNDGTCIALPWLQEEQRSIGSNSCSGPSFVFSTCNNYEALGRLPFPSKPEIVRQRETKPLWHVVLVKNSTHLK
jgi:hypothetical protein